MAQASTTAPRLTKTQKGEYVLGTRVNPALRAEIDLICQRLDVNAPAVIREGLILFCQSHPAIDDETTQRVIDAVSQMKSFVRVGRICPTNNGEG